MSGGRQLTDDERKRCKKEVRTDWRKLRRPGDRKPWRLNAADYGGAYNSADLTRLWIIARCGSCGICAARKPA